tara:strand:- start:3571 stop:4509 length:939 start_codon:yes stop_codon:yes gene_type:complete
MICLVTGGAGFIGGHLVEELLKEGNEVIVIDDFSTGTKDNLPEHEKLTVHEKSITEDLTQLFEGKEIEVVFHLAANPSVQYSIQHPTESHAINATGTLNLLNYCKNYKVKRFVLSSSCSVYGNRQELPLKETVEPDPLSPYALQKLVSEQYCTLFYKLYGIETINLRYFNVYGPRQNPAGDYASLIPKFITLVLQQKQPTIFGDGTQTRDFVYVKDIVRANILAAQTTNKECYGNIINIGSGKNMSVNETTKLIIACGEQQLEPIHAPPVIEPKDSLSDITKAKELLNWEPQKPFAEGLQETYNYFTTKKHL